jgi:hypothetical protein
VRVREGVEARVRLLLVVGMVEARLPAALLRQLEPEAQVPGAEPVRHRRHHLLLSLRSICD